MTSTDEYIMYSGKTAVSFEATEMSLPAMANATEQTK